MNLRPLLALLSVVAVLTTSCGKKDNSNNPCEGLLNESPPTTILLKFIDKSTGENLILSKDIKESDVSVIYKKTNEVVKNWRIMKSEPSNSLTNGTLGLTVFHETEGEYPYQIQLGNAASATLSYTITKKKSDNPCKPYYFPMSDIKITDHTFSVMEHQGKEVPNFLVLEF